MRLVTIVLATTMVHVLCGCGGGKPPSSGSPVSGEPAVVSRDEKTPAKPVAGMDTNKPADYSFTAEQYSKEWSKDEKAAEIKYKDAIVELTGVVASVDAGGGGPLVQLESGKQFSYLYCWTAETEPWAKVAAGQQIKLKGKALPKSVEPQLGDCVILETSASTAIQLSANQLAAEYIKDKDTTKRKYHKKTLIVTGIVRSAKREDDDIILSLHSGNDINVICYCRVITGNEPAIKLRVGQQVQVVGLFNEGLIQGEKETGMVFCQLITGAK